jgi:hypothetical protein
VSLNLSQDVSPYTPEEPAPPRRSRRWLWVFAAVALLLALALTPPLLNVNRLRRRIAASMSASLGRPVHLDSVSMHLLPVPGFTLQNLVVSEDPAFGFEPTIRANTVEATLRTSSLWRRQVEFSSIRFIEPSLNLVRNPQGRWNLQSLLVHAANVGTAPTAQSKPGPEPRFPYIEASGARVNLKLANEKKPFSLTDADFALWLPTASVWHVRLEAKPARTDTNINDPGTVRLEGTLESASTMANVPVDLHASWNDAPLGEASRLLTGDDAGWRGNLALEASLTGRLGAAKLTSRLHLENLRRADFIPAQSLDVAIDCSGTLELMTALVHTPACTLPAQQLTAVADSVDLTELSASGLRNKAGLRSAPGLRLGSPGLQSAWLLDWARLFSQRIPTDEPDLGKLNGSFAYDATGDSAHPSLWQGTWHSLATSSLPAFTLTADDGKASLLPVNILPAAATNLLALSATATPDSLTLIFDGTATAKQIATIQNAAPQLTDGFQQAQPDLFDPATTKPVRVALTCTRPWHEPQTCTSTIAAPPPKPTRHHRKTSN